SGGAGRGIRCSWRGWRGGRGRSGRSCRESRTGPTRSRAGSSNCCAGRAGGAGALFRLRPLPEDGLGVERLLSARRGGPPSPVGPVGQTVERPEVALRREFPAAREEAGVLGTQLAIDAAVAATVLLLSRALVLAVLMRHPVDLQAAPALLQRAQTEVPILVAVYGGIEATRVLPAPPPDQAQLGPGDRAVHEDVGVEVGEAEHARPGPDQLHQ